MKILKYTLVLFTILIGILACDEAYEPYIPEGRVEEISFAKDTFVFGEAAGVVEIPIVAEKYVNYATPITIEVSNGTALEDSNFVVRSKDLKILLGKESVSVELQIMDDTLINESRSFSISLKSILGGGIAGTSKQSCVVIIRNNDYIPEATIKFDNARDTIREDGIQLIVPFHLTMPAKSDVVVTFAQSIRDGQTAKQGEHFDFADGKNRITIPEGSLMGEVKLKIINNTLYNTARKVHFNLALHHVEGALKSVDSLTTITILDDDLNRTLSFGKLEIGEYYHEEAGTIEIPVILKGGRMAERLVSGNIILDSLQNCTAEDVTLITQEFVSAGDTTFKILVNLKDNEEFGEWSFNLVLRNLDNVSATESYLKVNVKDDERIIGFEGETFVENEGDDIRIGLKLKGGKALNRIRYRVEVLEEGTTAEDSQYSLPTSYIALLANQDNTSFTLNTHKTTPPFRDKKLKLKLIIEEGVGETSPGKILYDESQTCEVTIVNTDPVVSFDTSSIACVVGDTVQVPIQVSGITQTTMVYIEAQNVTGGIDFEFGGLAYNSSTPFMIPFPEGKSKSIPLVIKSVGSAVSPLILKIIKLDGGADNTAIDIEGNIVKLEF